MEIAAQQKYLSVVNETQDSINANMPARVRQQMHFCCGSKVPMDPFQLARYSGNAMRKVKETS
jgi:hypothetical protein